MATGKKALKWLMWAVGIISAIGIGGLFINGTMLNVVLLKLLPLLIHQIVGWTIIISTVAGAVVDLMK
jgi:hypothetical protein